MKISLKWINEFVDVKEFLQKPQELAEKLTRVGLEVEDIQDRSKDFQSVIIGQIKELNRHPQADRLTVCQVDVGDKSPRQIVCGATNHKAGDKVVVSLPGAVLPGGFAIKESEIRGQKSLGMLCSEKELGLKEESPGILILEKDAPVGRAFAEHFEFDDVVFEIKVTPNRADCLSHFGLAREIAVVLDRKCTLEKPKLKFGGGSSKDTIKLSIKDKDLCPRYAGRLINSIKVGPSPNWMKRRLETVGMNSINNVVDVTNYVMMELGQPLHAFDVSQIGGKEIRVQKASAKEKFIKLDGMEIELTGEELTIRDAKKAVALAGVVGGLNSGVTEQTREIFLEAAHFQPMSVRKTSRLHGIETESAYRFARGTDPEMVVLAMDRACQLFGELAGGECAKDWLDEYPGEIKIKPIVYDHEQLVARLGFEVEEKAASKILKRLGCEIKDGKNVTVVPPTHRWDIRIKEDLIEEVARLVGYEHIPEIVPTMTSVPTDHEKSYRVQRRFAETLSGVGFRETVTYGFLNENYQHEVLADESRFKNSGIEWTGPVVSLKNPLSDDLNVMRRSLVPGLLKVMTHNQHHGINRGRIFEIGPVFAKGASTQAQYVERNSLALMTWGLGVDLWQKGERAVTYDLKAAIDLLLSQLKLSQWEWRPLDKATAPELIHPGQAASLFCEGKNCGFIGTLHPLILDKWKLRESVAIVEIDFDRLTANFPRKIKMQKISRFPQVDRDLAFVVKKSTPILDLEKEIRKSCGPLLKELRVFDVFSGGQLGADARSIAFRMTLQDMETTLTDERLLELQGRIIKSVSEKLGVEVRS